LWPEIEEHSSSPGANHLANYLSSSVDSLRPVQGSKVNCDSTLVDRSAPNLFCIERFPGFAISSPFKVVRDNGSHIDRDRKP
jgi:hypothetical protein